MVGDLPTYRDLWLAHPRRPAEEGPQDRGGRRRAEAARRELQGALHSLYGNYAKAYRAVGGERRARRRGGSTPPVFIVVCNNTNVSKMVFDYIAGWEKTIARRHDRRQCPASSHLFCNDDGHGGWLAPPEHDPRRLAPSSNPARR